MILPMYLFNFLKEVREKKFEQKMNNNTKIIEN